MVKPGSNGEDVPGPAPSKLGRLFDRIHGSHATERAIGDTAKGRRIKAKQAKDEKKKGQGK